MRKLPSATSCPLGCELSVILPGLSMSECCGLGGTPIFYFVSTEAWFRATYRSDWNVSYHLRRELLLTDCRFDRTAERHVRGRNVCADQPMRRRGKLVSHLRGSAPRSKTVGCRDGIA